MEGNRTDCVGMDVTGPCHAIPIEEEPPTTTATKCTGNSRSTAAIKVKLHRKRKRRERDVSEHRDRIDKAPPWHK